MSAPRRVLAALALVWPAVALAGGDGDGDGYGALGKELTPRKFASPREGTDVILHGYLRLRGESLFNLDLDHGLTPSGDPLFPVPLADPEGQTLSTADTRLRTDLSILAPGMGVSVNVRVDVLDNLVLGSTPEGKPATGRAPTPTASPGQKPPTQAFRIKRAWGEVLTPFGVLAAGRMGAHWGLGMLANSGDCDDCDGGDAADRIAFVSPMFGHYWAISYDFTATGPTAGRRDNVRAIDLEPTDDVRTITFAVFDQLSDAARDRRRRAGRVTFEYGAYVSHRRQDNDIPADYLPAAQPVPIDPSQVDARDFRATAADLWLRVTFPNLRVEAEAAYFRATVGQPSLIPGVELDRGLESDQVGLAVESEYETRGGLLATGLDFGFASGDPAPGFGAFPEPNAPAAKPGDLDGPQADLPRDTDVDNFRFHPDYRIDRILFREIIGTVTDAVYLRPHLRLRLLDVGHGQLQAKIAVIASFAAEAESTPGGEKTLGVEIDPSLEYVAEDGFRAALDHAVFLPGPGFDNRMTGASADPAQLIRLRLGYYF